MIKNWKTTFLAAAFASISTIVYADHSDLYGTWSLPGESCDEWDPSESIMVVTGDRISFLEVGCDIQGEPGLVAEDTFRFKLKCSGIDSGPWDSVLVLQKLPENMVLQAFEGYEEEYNQRLKHCPH